MRKSILFCSKWVACAATYFDVARDYFLDVVFSALDEKRVGLERHVPQWGGAVSDIAINDDSPQLLLTKDDNINLIRPAHRNLDRTRLTPHRSPTPRTSRPTKNTKDRILLRSNAISLVKRTVSVAAAAKLLFPENSDNNLVRTAAEQMKGSLPQTWYDRLVAKFTEVADIDDEAAIGDDDGSRPATKPRR